MLVIITMEAVGGTLSSPDELPSTLRHIAGRAGLCGEVWMSYQNRISIPPVSAQATPLAHLE